MDSYRSRGKEVSMTKEESAKVLAVKYVLDYNTFGRSDKLKRDLIAIRERYQVGEEEDAEFEALFRKYCDDLRRNTRETPLWARKIMAERYALNV